MASTNDPAASEEPGTLFGIATNSMGKVEKNKKVKEGPCIFPFKYKRETHQKCYPTDKGEICATSVNDKQTLQTYGYCKKFKTMKKKKKLKIVGQKTVKVKTPVSMSSSAIPVVQTIKPPYNEAFVSLLGKLEKLMIQKGEPFRARAYQKAQQSIMLYQDPINSLDQIKDLKGVGKTILAKFQEYLETGKLKAIEKEKENPLLLFTNIYGVGPKKAQALIAKGITTIAQLRENQGELNDKQKIGLQYYEAIEERIPRAEIVRFETVLSDVFKELGYPSATMEIVGSYRRGAKDSGDIDIIITDAAHNPDLLSRFVAKLVDMKIVLHKLTDGKTKVLAIAELPKKGATPRRVDFLYTPPDEFAFAILYFTGSKIFNTVMRQRALDRGYTLNEHGIYHMVSGKKGAKVDQAFPTEKSIFDFLDMEYKKPEERIDARAVVTKTKTSTVVEDPVPVVKDPVPVVEDPVPVVKKNKSLKKPTKVVNPMALMRQFTKKGKGLLDTLSEDELVKMIEKSNDIYYNHPDKVILSDEQFDILKEYFEAKYPGHALLKKVGAPIVGKKDKVVLPYPMPSMDKIKPTTGALSKWLVKYNKPKSYVLSAKLDGVSGLYVVEGGKAKLYTRGDGIIGKDISHLIPFLRLPDPSVHTNYVIRGEFLISKENFAAHFKGKKNARNAVAGLINTLVGSDEHQWVDFVGYEVMKPEMVPGDQLKTLRDVIGMDTVRFEVVKDLSNEMLSEKLVEWRNDYKYEIDGIIVAHNKIYRARSEKNPEHAFAFKMVLSDQVAEAKVVRVEWNPSKHGYLKPRVEIEPIELGGVTITYATGKNAAFIEKNKIGVGSIVELVRSGDVIPDIKKVVVPAPEPSMPDVDYVWNETHVDIMLVNKSADATVREKNVLNFFKVLEVDGVGPGVVAKLMKAGYDSVPKILKMSEADFLGLEGFKQTLANKVHTNIHKALDEASLPILMKASNIFGRGFGEKKITPALEMYPDILVSKDSDSTKIDKLVKVSGWSTKSATEFVKHIDAFVKFLRECGLVDRLVVKKTSSKSKPTVDTSHPLYGKKVVMTGFRDKALEELIKSKGGEMGSSVSKKTFAVLVKDLDEDTGKAEQARALGVSLMTPDAFKKLYGL